MRAVDAGVVHYLRNSDGFFLLSWPSLPTSPGGKSSALQDICLRPVGPASSLEVLALAPNAPAPLNIHAPIWKTTEITRYTEENVLFSVRDRGTK